MTELFFFPFVSLEPIQRLGLLSGRSAWVSFGCKQFFLSFAVSFSSKSVFIPKSKQCPAKLSRFSTRIISTACFLFLGFRKQWVCPIKLFKVLLVHCCLQCLFSLFFKSDNLLRFGAILGCDPPFFQDFQMRETECAR